MERWFTKGFRDSHPKVIADFTTMFVATKVEGYVGCVEAIRDMDHRPLLPKIKAPTLVIAGRFDPATPLPSNEFIRDHIPGAELAVLDTAHIANMELPQAYADTVLAFLLGKA
jgi:3-oxoadipate enol-lactonase